MTGVWINYPQVGGSLPVIIVILIPIVTIMVTSSRLNLPHEESWTSRPWMRDRKKDSSIDPKSALYYWLTIYNPDDLLSTKQEPNLVTQRPKASLEQATQSRQVYAHI
jgi:hypothetical protein